MRAQHRSHLAMALALALAGAIPAVAHEIPKAPAEAKARRNPVSDDEASIRAGQAVYEKHCLSCHGAMGKGEHHGTKGNHRPPDLTKVVHRQTDGELFWKITRGGGAMPSYTKSLTEEERWQVTRYLRSFDPLQ